MTTGLLLGIAVALGGGGALGWWLGRLGESDRRRATEVYYEERMKVCERARARARIEVDELGERLRAYEGFVPSEGRSRTARTPTKPAQPALHLPVQVVEPPPPKSAPVERVVPSAAKKARRRVSRERVNGNGHHAVADGPGWLLVAAEGAPDDLKAIRGLGPVLERGLNRLGVFHYRQLAQMTAEDAAWLAPRLKVFPGRLLRDDWAAQAREIDRHNGEPPQLKRSARRLPLVEQ